MQDLKNNKVFWVLVVITIFNVGAFLVGRLLVDRVADRVINKLKKEYSPSPYGPGFDPDKVNPNAFKVQQRYFDEGKIGPNKVVHDETLKTGDGAIEKLVEYSDKWREDWEKERGAKGVSD